MDISNIVKPVYSVPGPGHIAAQGTREQLGRLDRNIDAVANQDDSQSSDSSKQYALVEQHEIVNAVRANTKSLQIANQAIGTLVNITDKSRTPEAAPG